MKQTDPPFNRPINIVDQYLSPADRKALHDNLQEIDNMHRRPDTPGPIPDNKGIVQGVGNFFKELTGRDLFKDTIIIGLLVVSLVLQKEQNGIRGLIYGMDDDVSFIIPPDNNSTNINTASTITPKLDSVNSHSVKRSNMANRQTIERPNNSGQLTQQVGIFVDTLWNNAPDVNNENNSTIRNNNLVNSSYAYHIRVEPGKTTHTNKWLFQGFNNKLVCRLESACNSSIISPVNFSAVKLPASSIQIDLLPINVCGDDGPDPKLMFSAPHFLSTASGIVLQSGPFEAPSEHNNCAPFNKKYNSKGVEFSVGEQIGQKY